MNSQVVSIGTREHSQKVMLCLLVIQNSQKVQLCLMESENNSQMVKLCPIESGNIIGKSSQCLVGIRDHSLKVKLCLMEPENIGLVTVCSRYG